MFLVGMVHVPIIVDILRFFFPKWRLSRLTTRVIKYVLITIMTIIYCIALGYHVMVFLPLLSDNFKSFKWVLHLGFACWLWINMIVNYSFAVFVHPGTDKTHLESDNKKDLPMGTAAQERDRNTDSNQTSISFRARDKNADPNQTSILFRAQRGTSSAGNTTSVQDSSTDGGSFSREDKVIPKHGMDWEPKRSYFCKACQTKILYMDHHCPFTGNCVGFRNYSHFYLWLLYGTIGLAYAALVTFPYFNECKMKNVWWFFGFVESRVKSPVCAEVGVHPYIFLPALAGCWVCVNMLSLQTLTLLTDVSTFNCIVNSVKLPLLRFAWHRIRGGKFREPNSRLNVLLLRQRKSVLWFLLPVRNDRNVIQ